MSQLYIHKHLVIIQLLVNKILCRQESVRPMPMGSASKPICPPGPPPHWLGDIINMLSWHWPQTSPGPLFVYVEVLQPSQPNGVMSTGSVYLSTLLLGRLSPPSGKPVLCNIFLPENDNCPSWISGRERMTVENISWSNLNTRMLPTRPGSNPQPPNHQSDVHLTEPPRPAPGPLLFSYRITGYHSINKETVWICSVTWNCAIHICLKTPFTWCSPYNFAYFWNTHRNLFIIQGPVVQN